MTSSDKKLFLHYMEVEKLYKGLKSTVTDICKEMLICNGRYKCHSLKTCLHAKPHYSGKYNCSNFDGCGYNESCEPINLRNVIGYLKKELNKNDN